MARLENLQQRCYQCEPLRVIAGTDYKELSFGVIDKQPVVKKPRSEIRDTGLDGSESRFLRCNRIGFERKINLSIIGIAVHVGEVRLNGIKERAGIKGEEKRTEGSLRQNQIRFYPEFRFSRHSRKIRASYLTGVSRKSKPRMETDWVLPERYDLNQERGVTDPKMRIKACE